VRRTQDHIVVAVAEGVVRVASTAAEEPIWSANGAAVLPQQRRLDSQLKAGQRMTVDLSGPGSHFSAVDTSSVAGWREGRLQYVNEPLEFVVADLTRYSAHRIAIDDPDIASLRVTGVVFEQRTNAWLASLEATLPVQVVTETDGASISNADESRITTPRASYVRNRGPDLSALSARARRRFPKAPTTQQEFGRLARHERRSVG
jgi:transmembrane sensor